jgi:hypothetical protein
LTSLSGSYSDGFPLLITAEIGVKLLSNTPCKLRLHEQVKHLEVSSLIRFPIFILKKDGEISPQISEQTKQ